MTKSQNRVANEKGIQGKDRIEQGMTSMNETDWTQQMCEALSKANRVSEKMCERDRKPPILKQKKNKT